MMWMISNMMICRLWEIMQRFTEQICFMRKENIENGRLQMA